MIGVINNQKSFILALSLMTTNGFSGLSKGILGLFCKEKPSTIAFIHLMS